MREHTRSIGVILFAVSIAFFFDTLAIELNWVGRIIHRFTGIYTLSYEILLYGIFLLLVIGLYIADWRVGGHLMKPKRPTRDSLKVGGLTVLVVGGWYTLLIMVSAFDSVSLQFEFSESINRLWQALVFSGFIAPILEEYVMRGVVQRRLTDLIGFRKALVIASLLFMFAHRLVMSPAYFSRFFLGLSFGYVFHRTNRLSTAIIFHAVVNTGYVLLNATL